MLTRRATLNILLSDKRYEQFDGVSIDFSLGSALANIIMTEQENVLIKPLQQYSLTKHYMLYVDDTLLYIKQTKKKNWGTVLKKLRSIAKNLQFTWYVHRHGWFLPNYSYTLISITFITVFLLCYIGYFRVNLHSLVTWM